MREKEDRMRSIVVTLSLTGALSLGAAAVGQAEVRESLGDISGAAVAQAAPSAEGWAAKQQRDKEAYEHSQWAILPHRPNYILPYTYSFNPNSKPFEEATGERSDFRNYEMKFQLSFKLPIWQNMFGSNWDMAAAYTQVCMWQAYDDTDSALFRDTNYEPELVFVTAPNYQILGFTNRALGFGFVHQSNGRGSDALSRSWNRVYAAAVFDRGNFTWSIKPWWRVPEDEEDDNNTTISKYMGYGELRAGYKWGDHVFAMMFRNNLRDTENKGAIELDWSFPLYAKLKGYVQFFNGYGETMMDYNHANQRVGVGVLLSDWM